MTDLMKTLAAAGAPDYMGYSFEAYDWDFAAIEDDIMWARSPRSKVGGMVIQESRRRGVLCGTSFAEVVHGQAVLDAIDEGAQRD